MRLIYHPEAEAEISDAAVFYEQRMAGLGESLEGSSGSDTEGGQQPNRDPKQI